jgi:serine/threonine-protein kinase
MLGESMRRRHGHDRRPTYGGQTPRRRLRWGRWILATLIIIPFAFGTGYAVAALVVFPVVERDADELVAVPQLVGRDRAEAEHALETLGLTLAGTAELPHPFEPAGKVTAQSPIPGQRLQPGAAVQLAISAGRPHLPVPDLIGLPYRDAAALAESLGFTVNRREVPAPGAVGIVTRVEPAPGTMRELPTTIVLLVTAQPEIVVPDLDG